MANIKCFLLIATPYERSSLRRYASGSECSKGLGYHNAEVVIGKVLAGTASEDVTGNFRNDPRWPKTCSCGYEFKPEDEWQIFNEREYARHDNNEVIYTLREAPVGAIWECTWYEDLRSMTGTDGKSYCVRTPGGDWVIDSVASNCTRPDDLIHKCWVRHGEPPMFTVDKNGNTCNAGGGSILMGNYHGFLINGELTNC